MKREDLKKIEGLTPEQIDSILNLHQVDVSSWNQRIETQKGEIAKRDETINELTTKVSQYDGVNVAELQSQLTEWKSKYDTDMAVKDKEFAKQLFFSSIPFASQMAKAGIMADFDSKGFEFKDGKFQGADEYIEELRKTDPNAFGMVEKKKITTGFEQGKGSLDGDMDEVTRKFLELNPTIKLK